MTEEEMISTINEKVSYDDFWSTVGPIDSSNATLSSKIDSKVDTSDFNNYKIDIFQELNNIKIIEEHDINKLLKQLEEMNKQLLICKLKITELENKLNRGNI